jgi:hypothetical protein
MRTKKYIITFTKVIPSNLIERVSAIHTYAILHPANQSKTMVPSDITVPGNRINQPVRD